MEVYLEYVLIDNLVMDYILLFAALSLARARFLKRRLVLSAAVGAVCAAVLPLVNLPPLVLFIIKALSGVLLVYIAAEYKTKKVFLLCCGLFFLFTFMLGGLLIGIFFMLGIDYSLDANFSYISKIPIGVPLLGAVVLYITVKKIAYRLYKKRNVHTFIYKCRLSLGKHQVEVSGFLDSGNRLHFKNKLPVIICGAKTASGLFKEGLFTEGTRAEYMDFQTISGRGRMLCFKIDKLEIYFEESVNIIDNIMLGISPYHIKGDEEYDLILHPAVFKESENAEKTVKKP